VDTVSVDLSTVSGAQAAINNIDTAIASVSSIRSIYGATENRLGNSLVNIETFADAAKSAESTVRDADFGIESTILSQNQILQQAGVAILAQAKNLGSSALTLLQ
jgi:flagellin